MHRFTNYEFEQLKEHFDKNDTYGGAEFLTLLFEKFLENSMTENYMGDPDAQHSAPFEVGQGLCLTQEYYGEGYKPTLAIDTDDIKHAISIDPELIEALGMMRERIERLEAMHDEDSDFAHIPRIISTKEQYEAMKDEVDAEEQVLVTTTFDKAMSVL